MTSKDTAGPVMTLSEVGEILDLLLPSEAEADQLLAHLRDDDTIEIFGVVVITPAGHGLFTSYRKEAGQ